MDTTMKGMMHILGVGLVIIVGIVVYIGYQKRYGTVAEGMVTEVEDLKKQSDVMQTVYDELQNGIEDQTNRIQANAQMLLTVVSDTPNQTNSITHANVNMDDPSKTRIPKVAI
jgi:hypothetical protein